MYKYQEYLNKSIKLIMQYTLIAINKKIFHIIFMQINKKLYYNNR